MREVSTKLLEPYQLGVGSRDGATAAAHAARRFLNSGGCGLVKIDFRNAFNELSRSALLEAVMRLTSELFRLATCVYGRHSFLFYENDIIRSERGVQQGDPLGPLLFALALRDLSHNSIAPFAVYYLDDATIGGNAQSVHEELLRIRQLSGAIGLRLNEQSVK